MSVVTLAAVTGLALAGWWAPSPTTVEQHVVKFDVTPPDGVQIPDRPNTASISPDARAVAFVGESHGKSAIWVRALSSGDADAWQVPGSDGATASPFWSPDGREVAFGVPGLLRAVDVTSRSPRTICRSEY